MFDHISEVDWARAAAFIDGEGNIHITRRTRKSLSGHYLKIVITNTDPRLVTWFQERFGGAVVTSGKRKKQNHRTAFRWLAACETAAEVLRGCLPYLVLKRDQAEIALAFQSTLRGQGHKITEEVFGEREGYKLLISDAKWKTHKWPKFLPVN